jgi:hypothetical protein
MRGDASRVVVESSLAAREDDMRLKTLAAIVSFVLLTLNDGARAQQSESSVGTSPVWNDNSLITVQKKGGDPTRSGDVKIEFYGHDAFKMLWSARKA